MIEGVLQAPLRAANDARPWPFVAPPGGSNFFTTSHQSLTSKQLTRMRLYVCLIALDIFCLVASFATASVLRFSPRELFAGFDILLLVAPIYLVLAANNRAFGLQALATPKFGVERALKSLLVACAVGVVLLFSLKISTNVSRLIFGLGATASAVSIAMLRWVVGNLIGSAHSWRFTNDVVISDGASIRPKAGEIVIIAEGASTPLARDPLVMDRLGRVLEHADRVILAARPERRAAWTIALKGLGVDVEVLTPELDLMGPLELRRYGSVSTLLVSARPLCLADRFKKRTLDLILTVPAVLLLAIPMLLIGLAIRLESNGQALFRQPRVGHGNRIFQILKFRSMRVELSDGAGDRSTARDDHRVTHIGKFLRRTSLDELPQLLNVLKGDMSLVGPRPHALASRAEDALFWEIEGRYWERHGTKPGLTGLAQIRGFRGATESRSDLTNRVQSDLEYLVGWSLRRDILILFRTLKVLVHPNAY